MHKAIVFSHLGTLYFSCHFLLFAVVLLAVMRPGTILLFTVCSTVTLKAQVWFWVHVEVSLSKTLNPRSHLKLHLFCTNVCVCVRFSPDDARE